MSENKLIGSLVLRTIDIDPTRFVPIGTINGAPFENEFGILAANGAVATWKNINLRTCLGELYYKYDRFNLKLTAVQFRPTGSSYEDFHFIIYMSGLPFSSGYNTKLGPTNQVAIGSAFMATTNVSQTGLTFPILSGFVSFYKPLQNTFNITIALKNSSTNTVTGYLEKPTRLFGHWSLVFDVYGIEK